MLFPIKYLNSFLWPDPLVYQHIRGIHGGRSFPRSVRDKQYFCFPSQNIGNHYHHKTVGEDLWAWPCGAKEEGDLITNPSERKMINILVGGHIISSKLGIKYFGVVTDAKAISKDTWTIFFYYTCRKAASTSILLARMMSYSEALRYSRSGSLHAIIGSTALWGSTRVYEQLPIRGD